jgi:hypothetical protein
VRSSLLTLSGDTSLTSQAYISSYGSTAFNFVQPRLAHAAVVVETDREEKTEEVYYHRVRRVVLLAIRR